LTLGVMKDHEVLIEADGPDADAALAAISALITGNFGEV
jgi:phosphotransferase system HPr-like phosphotransfer protein